MNFSLQSISLTNFRGVNKTLNLNFANLSPGLYFIRGRNEVEPRLGSNGASKSTLFIDSIYWALTGRVARSSRPGSDIENWDCKKETTSVDLAFSLDGVNYIVRRSRNPISLELDNKKVEQQTIDNLLPLTDAALRRSILIDQFGEMFLSLRPEDKSRIFSDTLGLDIWIKASDKAGKEVLAANEEIQQYEKNLASIIGALTEVKAQFEIAETKEAEFETEIKASIADKKQTLGVAQESARTFRLELDNAKANEVFVRSEMVWWYEYADGADGKSKLEDLKKLLKQQQQSITDENVAGKLAAREEARLQEKLGLYSKGDKQCPECGQTITDENVEHHRRELDYLITQARGQYQSSLVTISALVKEGSGLIKEIEELEKSLVDYNEALARTSVCMERSLSADRQVKQLTLDLQELKERANPYTLQCDKLEARIKDLGAQRKASKTNIEHMNKQLEIYKFWQRGFKEIRLEQIDTTLMELEITANKHAEALGLEDWEMSFATERETQKGTISHGFSVFLFPPGQSEPISFESYSGGETQRLQLAATFGLAEVLLSRSGISTDFEVLDEPTIHLSPEGVDDLLACLRDRALELNRRIFIIDHHALDRGAFDGVITVVKNKSGVYLEDDGLLGNWTDIALPTQQMKPSWNKPPGKERVRL